MKIATIVGARPQFIKASAVSSAIGRCPDIEEILIHTGQHHDAAMSDVFFGELSIPEPRYHLGIGGLSHGAMTGRMTEALEQIFLADRPDWVLVYGDTNSTLAGALAAVKLDIPVAHVEAGLRSFNRKMPEEINRVLTDHCSTLLLSPTATATANLAREGLAGNAVIQVGDVMYDVAISFGRRAREQNAEKQESGGPPYVLATIHRQENTDDAGRLRAILSGLAEVATSLRVILPIHPRTRKTIDRFGLEGMLGSIELIDPVGYVEMVRLQIGAAVIATDSGGVQKEAFFHQVPCVTLRTETEWSELVTAGWNTLVAPTDPTAIAEAMRAAVGRTGSKIAPYGDGHSAEAIVSSILTFANGKTSR